MQLIDLSHDIHTGMPVFPGDESANLRRTSFIHRHGFAQARLSLSTHTGTHVDCAAHLFAEAPGLDWLGPDNFAGWAAVADLTALSGGDIGQKDLAWLTDMGELDFVLLHTGWDQHWKTEHYYQGGYPVLTETACRFLGGLGLKGVGMDTPSPDPVASRDLPAHHILFDHGLVIVENLTNLGGLPLRDFLFLGLPLRVKDGDGCPVRAVGLTL